MKIEEKIKFIQEKFNAGDDITEEIRDAIDSLIEDYNKKNKIIDLMADRLVEFIFNVKDVKKSFKEQIIKFFEKEADKNE